MKTLCTILFATFLMTACGDSDRHQHDDLNNEQPDYTQTKTEDDAVYEEPYKEGEVYETEKEDQ